MKKLFAILLAAMMVLSMTTIAFANGEEYDAGVETNEITITKTLKANGPDGTTVKYPADVLQFTAANGTVTDARAGVTAPALPPIDNVTVTEGATSVAIKVKLPKFDNVGVYTYEITETDTNVAGVIYRTETIKLVLTVVEQNGKKVIAAVHCETPFDANNANKTKSDTFENVFNAGSLKVSKQVTGNYGEREKDFHFTVKFSAPSGDTVNSTIKYGGDETTEPETIAPGWTGDKEVEITLQHNQSIQFDNIPAGVTYTVVEAEANKDGYTTTPTNDSGTIAAKTVTEASFVNYRTTTPDTGIVLDSLPYILIGAVAMAAAVVMIAKKRRVED